MSDTSVNLFQASLQKRQEKGGRLFLGGEGGEGGEQQTVGRNVLDLDVPFLRHCVPSVCPS